MNSNPTIQARATMRSVVQRIATGPERSKARGDVRGRVWLDPTGRTHRKP